VLEPISEFLVPNDDVRRRNMAVDRNEWISKRAYSLWEDAGRPDGTDTENWSKALAEFEMMETTRASKDGAEVLRFRRKPGVTRQTPVAGSKVA
jgi:hypothetical protein